MGRKTSYKDFLEFSAKLFVERENQLDGFLKKHLIDIESTEIIYIFNILMKISLHSEKIGQILK